ncbi:MAG: hypothetical protein JNK12_04975 [Acidimicrobiales bacterium]|nr:hypothetical protein [Acidimicrobiales bacterium]
MRTSILTTRNLAGVLLAASLVLGATAVSPAGAIPGQSGQSGQSGEAAAPEAAPVPRADYKFKGNRNSSVAGAPALFNVGPGANTFATENVDGVNRTVLRFPQANGVELRNATSVIPRDRYTIVMKFRLDDVSGYRRLINYVRSGSLADDGLYNLAGSVVLLPNVFSAPAPIDPDEYVNLVLTRSQQGRLRAYVDQVQVFDFVANVGDPDGVISAQNILRFFRDNADRQESSGAVSRIRLYDKAMTFEQVVALGT